MDSSHYDPTMTNLKAYLSALREMVGGESWDEVETFAILVWHESGLADHLPWTDVSDLVRNAWNVF